MIHHATASKESKESKETFESLGNASKHMEKEKADEMNVINGRLCKHDVDHTRAYIHIYIHIWIHTYMHTY